jgi:hypothetical protein
MHIYIISNEKILEACLCKWQPWYKYVFEFFPNPWNYMNYNLSHSLDYTGGGEHESFGCSA